MKAIRIMMVMVIAVTCIMPALAANEAQAATMWATCWVNWAGQAGSYDYVMLTDATGAVPAINKTWFTLSNAYGNARDMLAMSLTAMVSGLKIQVRVTDTVPYSMVNACYLMNQ